MPDGLALTAASKRSKPPWTAFQGVSPARARLGPDSPAWIQIEPSPRAARGMVRLRASLPINVNAVSPANIQTPMHTPDEYDALAGMVPVGRIGRVSDVVDGIMFLEASPFITGEIVHIDGGQIAGH